MKILVTGGAGYKGVLLTKKLLELGHSVTILDNFMFGYDPVLHLMDYPKIEIRREDIRNLTKKTVKGFDVIVHLAGLSGYPACEANPNSAKLINVDASKKLAGLLGKGQLVVYASTTSFYGKSGNVCDENSPVDPVSLYGITKYQAEQIFMQRENAVALRFATIFGLSPRMRIDLLVNDFTYRAVNDRCIVLFESKSKRTFLHIKDAVDAYSMAIDSADAMKGEIFNVGHESLNFTKLEIAQKINEYTGCKIIDSDMKDFDVRNFSISFKKIQALGFVPKQSLDDGVAEMVKLFNFYKPFSTYKTI